MALKCDIGSPVFRPGKGTDNQLFCARSTPRQGHSPVPSRCSRTTPGKWHYYDPRKALPFHARRSGTRCDSPSPDPCPGGGVDVWKESCPFDAWSHGACYILFAVADPIPATGPSLHLTVRHSKPGERPTCYSSMIHEQGPCPWRRHNFFIGRDHVPRHGISNNCRPHRSKPGAWPRTITQASPFYARRVALQYCPDSTVPRPADGTCPLSRRFSFKA